MSSVDIDCCAFCFPVVTWFLYLLDIFTMCDLSQDRLLANV